MQTLLSHVLSCADEAADKDILDDAALIVNVHQTEVEVQGVEVTKDELQSEIAEEMCTYFNCQHKMKYDPYFKL